MNKDILFSLWYDSLEGTKSQGFAYKAWCAGWDAAAKPWVGLTDDEKLGAIWTDGSFASGVEWAEAKLKEKNT